MIGWHILEKRALDSQLWMLDSEDIPFDLASVG